MSFRNGFLISVFLAPLLIISVPGVPPALGRLLAATILYFGGTAFFLLAGLVPRLNLVSVGPKLRRPEFDAIRPKLERNLRFFILGLGILFFLFVALPFAEDLGHLCYGDKPTQVVETPQSVASLFGAWFLVQFVRVPSEPSLSLLYSTNPVRTGEQYQFLVLPRSHLILEFHETAR